MDQYWPVAIVPGSENDPAVYGTAPHLAPAPHPSLDIHMGHQTGHYQYYRKHGTEDVMAQTAPTNRLQGAMWGTNIHSFGADQQWRHGADGSIMEMRKEKSRDAARSRRGKENAEFYELAKMLPLPPAITSQLDKASIIRLTISYLKLRDFTTKGDPPWTSTTSSSLKSLKSLRTRTTPCLELFDVHQGTHILQSLDGFAFTLAADGRFLYISETVSIYLGLSQVEMAGSSVFEYVHQEDHQELAEHLGITLTSSATTSSSGTSVSSLISPPISSSLTASSSPSSLASDDSSHPQILGTMNPDGKSKLASSMSMSPSSSHKGYDRAFCIRMKSTLTKRGCHFKSSGYRVVLVLGCLRPQSPAYPHSQNQRKSSQPLMGMVGIAIALPSPTVNELKLESDMFVCKISLDFRLAHCEPKVSDLLQYSPDELNGRSLYSLCHGQDLEKLRKTHTDLIKKGQVMSPYYRILNKNGGYVWIQTCATVICNSKNNDDQNIICVNYVLSGHLNDTLILDQHQLDPSTPLTKSESTSDYKVPSPSKNSIGVDGQNSQEMIEKSSTPRMSVRVSQNCSPQSMDHHLSSNLSDHQHHLTPHHTSPITQMDHETNHLNDSHIQHVGPLTPQLTPVSQMGGNLTPVVSSEGEIIKTETGSILTSLNSSAEQIEDLNYRNQKFVSSVKDHTPLNNLHYTSLAVVHQSQLSPASNNRYSPISSTQLSPDQYTHIHHKADDVMEGSGVRHLEVAMTRHLPQEADGLGQANSGTSFSAIQWAGGQEHHHHSGHILRQVCTTKRDTVIKTSRDPQDFCNDLRSCSDNIPIASHDLGMPSVTTGYPGYHISPPSSVSPDRLKLAQCDPYSTDIYNAAMYSNNPVLAKNTYDSLRWYPA